MLRALLVEPRDERRRGVPANADHRVVVPSPTAIIRKRPSRFSGIDVVLVESNGILREMKRPDRHLMSRHLVSISRLRDITHLKSPRRYSRHRALHRLQEFQDRWRQRGQSLEAFLR